MGSFFKIPVLKASSSAATICGGGFLLGELVGAGRNELLEGEIGRLVAGLFGEGGADRKPANNGSAAVEARNSRRLRGMLGSFRNFERLVGGSLADLLDDAVWPADLDRVRLAQFA